MLNLPSDELPTSGCKLSKDFESETQERSDTTGTHRDNNLSFTEFNFPEHLGFALLRSCSPKLDLSRLLRLSTTDTPELNFQLGELVTAHHPDCLPELIGIIEMEGELRLNALRLAAQIPTEILARYDIDRCLEYWSRAGEGKIKEISEQVLNELSYLP